MLLQILNSTLLEHFSYVRAISALQKGNIFLHLTKKMYNFRIFIAKCTAVRRSHIDFLKIAFLWVEFNEQSQIVAS